MSPAMLMSGWFSTSRMEIHYNKILKQAQVGRDNPTDLGPFFICWGIFLLLFVEIMYNPLYNMYIIKR